ncbi:hypothetical protein MMMB2_0590 [Mycobacterium marinum MB2]|nr:hypothetical protein MMMB2_0590 [Mycobacterium marinum MB2]EPQ79784.1 hypothetical protein MMEU_0308 [Mycobacterium marinum str. Europe]
MIKEPLPDLVCLHRRCFLKFPWFFSSRDRLPAYSPDY